MKKLIIVLSFILLMLTVSCDDYIDDLSLQSGLTEGLVAYWPVTETSGTIVKDASGNTNDLTCTDATFNTGKFGNGLYFGSESSEATVFKSEHFFQNNEFTISMWIKAEIDNIESIFATSLSAVSIGQDNNDSLRIIIVDSDDSNYPVSYTSDVFTIDNWVYITLTHENDRIYIYMNSNLAASFAVANGVSKSADELKFSWGPWQGTLDEIRIYDRALSQKEIEALMVIGKD